MNAKALLIPIAAFAVTVTGASAFNSEVLQNAGLSDDQISAFEQAKELKDSGDTQGARDVLVEAGIDAETLEKVREAMKEYRKEHHDAVRTAVEAEDYDAFKVAVAGSPMADIITSESDFKQLVEAHTLIEAGDKEAAKAIFADLGLKHPGMGHGHHKGPHKGMFESLTDTQKEALKTARKAGDKEAVQQIFTDAGIEMPQRGERGQGSGGLHN